MQAKKLLVALICTTRELMQGTGKIQTKHKGHFHTPLPQPEGEHDC